MNGISTGNISPTPGTLCLKLESPLKNKKLGNLATLASFSGGLVEQFHGRYFTFGEAHIFVVALLCHEPEFDGRY